MRSTDKTVLIVAALAVLGVAGYLIWTEAAPGYSRYQREFRNLVRERLGDARAEGVARGVQQVWVRSLDRVDRCTTCHLGVTWTDLAGAPVPYSPHPPGILAKHPIEKYGCSICHGGQGFATKLPDAHGWQEYWTEPLLDSTLATEYGLDDRSAFMQMRCNGCHRYDRETKGASLVNLAKRLVTEKGCRACHVINGRGGNIGPDLTRVGQKAAEQYDYGRLTSIASIYGWHVAHLKDPKAFTPTSVMPQFGFSSEQANAIALLLLSWRDVQLPPQYLPGVALHDVPTPEEAERERVMREGEGKFFVEKTCFICHDVSSLGISSATKIGPDLAIAVEDAPKRFGRPVDEFLRAPTGTMQVVLSRQIRLTPAEVDEAIRLLHVAYDKHRAGGAKAVPEEKRRQSL